MRVQPDHLEYIFAYQNHDYYRPQKIKKFKFQINIFKTVSMI